MLSTEEGAVLNGDQLSYAGRDATSIHPDLASKYGDKVKRLDLSFNLLSTIKGVGEFGCLQELILDNNCLTDELEIPKIRSLQTLTLNKNKISNLEGLLDRISHNLPSLTYLSLLGNTACPNELSVEDSDEEDYQRYRYYVIYRLPNLRFLDSRPVKEDERKEAKRVGSFTRVVSAKFLPHDQVSSPEKDTTVPTGFTPLPSASATEGDHHGTFGKCRYVYYGKHSEGNRFILNNDL